MILDAERFRDVSSACASLAEYQYEVEYGSSGQGESAFYQHYTEHLLIIAHHVYSGS